MSSYSSKRMKYVAIPGYVSDWCEQYVQSEQVKNESERDGSSTPTSINAEQEMLIALSKIGAHVVRCHKAEAFHMLQLDSNSKDLFELHSVNTDDWEKCAHKEADVMSLLSDKTMNELKLLVVLGNEFGSGMKFETVSDLVIYLLEQVANGSANPQSASREVLNILGLVANTALHSADSGDRVLDHDLVRKLHKCN